MRFTRAQSKPNAYRCDGRRCRRDYSLSYSSCRFSIYQKTNSASFPQTSGNAGGDGMQQVCGDLAAGKQLALPRAYNTSATLCSSLKILLLGHNQLTALPEGLFQLEGLVNLDVQHNKLTAVGGSWSQLTNLKVNQRPRPTPQHPVLYSQPGQYPMFKPFPCSTWQAAATRHHPAHATPTPHFTRACPHPRPLSPRSPPAAPQPVAQRRRVAVPRHGLAAPGVAGAGGQPPAEGAAAGAGAGPQVGPG